MDLSSSPMEFQEDNVVNIELLKESHKIFMISW